MDDNTVMETTEQARAFFANDRFAADSGMRIELAERRHSVIRLPLDERHLNAVGGVMGGVYCTLADFACAVASNFGTGTGLYVSADAHISFLNPCRGKELRAEAVSLKDGAKLLFLEVSVTDELGTNVAKADFTMCRVK